MISIFNLPIPPSINRAYETTGRVVTKRNKQGKIYQGVATSRYGSPELVHFKKQCQSFYNLNYQKIDSYKPIIQSWIDQGYVVKVEAYVAFEHSRAWTLEHKAKQIDSSNRIKALEDGLAVMLDIDDKWNFLVSIEKVTCDKDSEQCVVYLSPMKPRTLNDIKGLKYKQG